MMRSTTLLFAAVFSWYGCSSELKPIAPPRCDLCHDLAGLSAEVSTAPAREWTRQAGRGLTRRDVLILTSTKRFMFAYPRRGRHESKNVEGCTECHPVSLQGIRHGISQYPLSARDAAVSSGTDCASSCHSWLPESGTSTGFTAQDGSAPSYSGSLRPHDLLTATTTAHTRIYTEGYRAGEDDSQYIEAINPGCAGCHNVKDENHGTITECLDCHRFGGTSGNVYQAHMAAINDHRHELDPNNTAESECSYCHGFSDEPTELKNAACYNCHLSGHQPVAENGKPHFWAP